MVGVRDNKVGSVIHVCASMLNLNERKGKNIDQDSSAQDQVPFSYTNMIAP